MKNIVLIGMPGCGKTTLGKMLAKKIGYAFCDADEFLEQQEQTTIKELFAISEAHFRQAEMRTSAVLAQKSKTVIATGGGVIKHKENMEAFGRLGIIVFIDREPSAIVQDIIAESRPLLTAGTERIYKLYEERINLYRQYADYTVCNTGTLENVIEDLLATVKWE